MHVHVLTSFCKLLSVTWINKLLYCIIIVLYAVKGGGSSFLVSGWNLNIVFVHVKATVQHFPSMVLFIFQSNWMKSLH